MPVPGAVAFTPFVDQYGMLSLKDITVEGWGDSREERAASLTNVPVVPVRTPMFNSRVEPAETQTGRQDAPLERGADLTRTWILFFEALRRLVGRLGAFALGTRRLHAVLCWVDETEVRDVWATIGAVDATTDPLIVTPATGTPRTAIPPYVEDWSAGDYVVWNDPSAGEPFSGTVSTLGARVTWVSGALFETTMAGHPITVNGTDYTVAAVERDGRQLTLATTAGTQTAVAYTALNFRRRYECGQVTAIDAETGECTIRRHWPGSAPGNRATFESYRESHANVRLYRLQTSLVAYEIKQDAFLTDEETEYSGVPRRWDIVLPHAAVVACYVAAENESGVGAWTGMNLSYPVSTDVRLLPPAPGLRTCVGAAYWFEEPGDIVARTRPDGAGGTIQTLNFYPAMPIRIQDWASIRTVYGFVGTPAKNPAGTEPLKVRLRILYAAQRIDGKQLYDPAQPWTNFEDLIWQKGAERGDTSSADQGTIAGIPWSASQENPPTERRMPYCEQELFYWDPEGVAKAWPPPVLEADAWLTFDVLTATVGDDAKAPSDLVVVVQT